MRLYCRQRTVAGKLVDYRIDNYRIVPDMISRKDKGIPYKGMPVDPDIGKYYGILDPAHYLDVLPYDGINYMRTPSERGGTGQRNPPMNGNKGVEMVHHQVIV